MQPSGPSRRTTGTLAIVAWLVWTAIGVRTASAQQPVVFYVHRGGRGSESQRDPNPCLSHDHVFASSITMS